MLFMEEFVKLFDVAFLLLLSSRSGRDDTRGRETLSLSVIHV